MNKNESNVLNKLKSQRPFKKWDLLLYALTLIFIFTLFLTFVITPNAVQNVGFKVVKDGKTVLTFNYESEELKVSNAFKDYVESDVVNRTIKIYTADKSGFNTLTYNTAEKSVKVTDSNCDLVTSSRDCLYFPAIKDNHGSIFCVPHSLKILPLSSKGFMDAVIG